MLRLPVILNFKARFKVYKKGIWIYNSAEQIQQKQNWIGALPPPPQSRHLSNTRGHFYSRPTPRLKNITRFTINLPLSEFDLDAAAPPAFLSILLLTSFSLLLWILHKAISFTRTPFSLYYRSYLKSFKRTRFSLNSMIAIKCYRFWSKNFKGFSTSVGQCWLCDNNIYFSSFMMHFPPVDYRSGIFLLLFRV